jgi:hypothetical protein
VEGFGSERWRRLSGRMGRKVLKFGMRRGWLGFEGIVLLR